MRIKKYIAILFIVFLIIPSLLSNVVAQSDEKTVLDQVLVNIYEKTASGSLRTMFSWGIKRFNEPEVFEATPNNLTVEYLSKSEIIIGIKNQSGAGYISLKEIHDRLDPRRMFTGFDWEFTVDIPENVPENSFKVVFDPPILRAGEEGDMKTRLIINTKYPKDATIPKELILRVNISRYVTADNLFIAPKPTADWPWYPTYYAMWFLNSLGPPFFVFPFGPYYSGKRVYDAPSMYIDILVRTNRFHLAEIRLSNRIEMGPDEIRTIPIEVKNLGSHIDTFNFKITKDQNSDLIVAAPPAITLAPNEIGYTSIDVLSSERFQDLGTVHAIQIQAYSIYDNDTYFNNTISVLTRGAHVSEQNMMYSVFLFIIISIIFSFFYFRRKSAVDKLCKKPQKPWTIAKNKEKLEKLKEKDKEKYEKTLKKMQTEYEEEMSLYKEMQKAALKKVKNQNGLFSTIKEIFTGFTSAFKRDKKQAVEERIFCSNCNAEIFDKSFELCPQCGKNIENKSSEQIKATKKQKEKSAQIQKPIEIEKVEEKSIIEPVETPVYPEQQPISQSQAPIQKRENNDDWMKQQAIARVLQKQEKQKKKKLRY